MICIRYLRAADNRPVFTLCDEDTARQTLRDGHPAAVPGSYMSATDDDGRLWGYRYPTGILATVEYWTDYRFTLPRTAPPPAIPQGES